MHILVVDDDILSRTILARLLTNLGYQSTEASSGREALLLLAQSRFDLVLMDLQMPECNGYATTLMIRAPESSIPNPDIPVIALTADSCTGTHERCLAAGLDGYLIKPVTCELLQTTINKHLFK